MIEGGKPSGTEELIALAALAQLRLSLSLLAEPVLGPVATLLDVHGPELDRMEVALRRSRGLALERRGAERVTAGFLD